MSTERISGLPTIFPEGGLQRNDDEARFELGSLVFDVHGNAYRYIKANEALAIGQAVTAVAKAAWDSTIVLDGAASSGDSTIHVDTTTSALTANQYAGYYVSQATASGLGIGYRIAGHDAMDASGEGDVRLEDSLAEDIADGAVLYIYNPYLMELTDGTTEVVQGIAIGTITSAYYGFVQVGGHCRRVAVGHSTSAAIVINEPLTPLATPAGSLQGVAAGTPNEAEIFTLIKSRVYALQAVNANTTGYVEAKIMGII